MKKFALAVAAFAALTFASCGGNKTSDQNEAAQNDSTEVPVSDATIETTADAEGLADNLTTQLDAELQKDAPDAVKVKQLTDQIKQASEALQNSGNTEVAKAYASKVKNYLEQNADKIKSIDPQSITVLDVVNAAANLPQSAKDAAAQGVDAVKADGQAAKAAAEAAKGAAESAGKQVVSDAKAAAKQTADKAKADAKAAGDAAVKKANDKANEAVQKGAAKASDAINKGLSKALGK